MAFENSEFCKFHVWALLLITQQLELANRKCLSHNKKGTGSEIMHILKLCRASITKFFYKWYKYEKSSSR